MHSANGSVRAGLGFESAQQSAVRHYADAHGQPRPSSRSIPQSAYALETANYRDFVILNAGARFDQYDIAAKKGSAEISASTRACGTTISARSCKPIPITSLYWAYGTSSEPVGAELDGTSANYGGFNPTSTGQSDFWADRKQGAGSRQQMGAVRRTSACHRRAVPHRRRAMRASSVRTGAGTNITAGAAYHVQGIDLGAEGNITDKWSVYTGLVLMKTRVDHVRRADQYRTAARLHRQPILQRADQIQAHRRSRSRRAGDLSLENLRRHAARRQSGHACCPTYWRFDAFLEGNVHKNWEWKLFANNIFNKLYYDAFYQSARAVRAASRPDGSSAWSWRQSSKSI